MFFQSIYQMITAGTDLSINIRKVENSLSVAVMPRRNNLKEDMRQNMVPLVVNGTPAELDMGFLQTIIQPLQKVQGKILVLTQHRRHRGLFRGKIEEITIL